MPVLTAELLGQVFPWAVPGAGGSHPGPIRRDDVALEDVVARLRATSLFDAVIDDTPWDEPQSGATGAVAWVARETWTEGDRAMPITNLRDLEYRVWIAVRGTDRRTNRARLARIEAAAQDALTGVALGGFTMPAFTRISRGGDSLMLAAPNASCDLRGTARYSTAGYTGHDTTARV